MAGYNQSGVLADTYGAIYAGGQRYFTWTNDAFNPTAWGVTARTLPMSAPELLNQGNSPSVNTSSIMNAIPTWSLHSIIPWIILALVIGIPLYHWWEYRK